MSDPIKPLLGEYVDQELSPPERQRVEAHLSSCSDCRAELAELRAVSGALHGLGAQALPVGFMQRLERRRAEPAAQKSAGWLPAPARLAAFAASAAIAVIVLYDRLPTLFPVAGVSLVSGAASDLQPVPASALKTPPAAAAREAAEPQPMHKLARAKGEPIFNASAPAPSLAPAAAPSRALAAPASAAASNEQLHARLEAEKKEMGIKQIILPQDDARHPMGEMTDMAMAARANAMTLAMSKGLATVGGAVPQILQPAAVRGQALGGAQMSSGASGIVLGSEQERAALWRHHGLTAAAPPVDYAKKRLAVVVANDFRTAVEIVDVRELPDRFVVVYRLDELPDEAAAQARSASYQFRVLPKTDAPVTFERVP